MSTPPTYPGQEGEVEQPEWRENLLADEPDVDLDALLARTRAAVDADRGPMVAPKRLSTTARTAIVLLAAVGMSGLTVLAAPRPDFDELSVAYVSITLVGSLAAALVAVALAMRPTWKPEASPMLAWGALALAVGVPLALAGIPEPVGAFQLPAAMWPTATAGCFLYASFMALAVVLCWRLVEQRRYAGVLRWATAIAGACAVGTMTLQLHCPVTEASHLVLGHGSVGLVWAAVGAVGAWLANR